MNFAAEALALLAWLWAGARAAAALLPPQVAGWPRPLLVHIHGTVLGMAAAAAAWLLRWWLPALPLAEAALAIGLGALMRPRATPAPTPPTPQTTAPRWLLATGALALLCAAATFVLHSQRAPHGGWDAWAIWNLRAQSLHAPPATWTLTLAARPGLSHPDYPLLLPATLARLATLVGALPPWLPAALAGWFTLATLGALAAWLAARGDHRRAGLAVTVLAGVPAFTALGAAQYADVPLALMLLLTLAPLSSPGPRTWLLAGLMAGCAAWTKNEGLVPCATLPLAAFLATRRVRAPAGVLLGLLPLVTVVAAFKAAVGQPNDVVHGDRADAIIALLCQPGRHATAALGLLSRVLRLGNGLPLAAAALLLWQRRGARVGHRAGEGTTVALTVLALQLCTYHLVYVITPTDQTGHLRTSAERLLLQLLPATLWWCCGSVHPPAAAVAPR